MVFLKAKIYDELLDNLIHDGACDVYIQGTSIYFHRAASNALFRLNSYSDNTVELEELVREES